MAPKFNASIDKLKKKNRSWDLIKLLQHPKLDTRNQAARALVEFKDIETIDALLETYQLGVQETRDLVEYILTGIGEPAVIHLISILKEDTPLSGSTKDLRASAARILGDIKEKRALLPLLDCALNDNDDSVRIHAVQAIAKVEAEWKTMNSSIAARLADQIVLDPAFTDHKFSTSDDLVVEVIKTILVFKEIPLMARILNKYYYQVEINHMVSKAMVQALDNIPLAPKNMLRNDAATAMILDELVKTDKLDEYSKGNISRVLDYCKRIKGDIG